MINTLKLFLVLLISIVGFGAFTLSEVEGQDMSSESYQLQGGNFNMTGGPLSSETTRLIDLVGQTSAQIFSAKGVIQKSGFLNRAAGSHLNLTISPVSIGYEDLIPNQPLYKNISLTVGNGDYPGYTLFVSQNHPLAGQSGTPIPDTVCDAVKNKPCTITEGNLWQDKRAFGFGYSVKSPYAPTSFNKEGFFRPFSTLEKKEAPAVIMESLDNNVSHTGIITLKLHIPPQQTKGIYQNELNFITVPGI